VAGLVGQRLLLGVEVAVQDWVLQQGQGAGLEDVGHVGELDGPAAPHLDRLLELCPELDEAADVVLVAVAEVRDRQRLRPVSKRPEVNVMIREIFSPKKFGAFKCTAILEGKITHTFKQWFF
jgi:hypothetical protein